MHFKRLPACSESPNCVSSQAIDPKHFIAPIPYAGSGATAFRNLEEIIEAFPGGRIVESSGSRLRAEFRTRWLKFIDDFEAILDETQNLIHVRSASRVGYWDLGTNRRRVETIRESMLARSGRSSR